MADGRISGDSRNNFDDIQSNPKVFMTNDTPEHEPGGLHLWPRPLARKWTLVLLLAHCLLYCARMAMPVCAVSMAVTFHWSKTEMGLVLGGFYWGYCLTQILGGQASDKVGGERVLFFSTASWAVITIATPLLGQLKNYSVAAMTIARFLLGLVQGVFIPSVASICSQRMTERDRGFFMSIAQTGCYIGTLLVGGIGSMMLERYGWELVFYATGLLSGLWALIVWQYFLKGQLFPKQFLSVHASYWSPSRFHWLALLRKPPVCAMIFAHMCHASASYTLLSWLPTFFKDSFPHVMGWEYNVIPWFIAILFTLCGGYISEFLVNREYGVTSVRKIMQLIAMGVSSIFILLLCRPLRFSSALMTVSVALGLNTFASSGVCINVQDLAPSYAGALYGFMNMCAAFMGLLTVSFSGYLIEVTMSWATVFSLITLLNVTGLSGFLLFGDTKRIDLECLNNHN